MISPFLMTIKQLKTVKYNDCGLSLHNIAKKLNDHPLSIDIFLKNHKKTKNDHKNTASEANG